MQDAYIDLALKKGSYPIAEKISREELSIPIYYGMTDKQISYVIDMINQFNLK